MPSPSAPSASPQPTLEWAEELPARFRDAAKGAVLERCYSIARRAVRVLFASQAMAERFTPALEHLRANDVPEGAHAVHVWDAASTATESPPVPVPDGSPPGTVFTHTAGARRALYMVGLRSL